MAVSELEDSRLQSVFSRSLALPAPAFAANAASLHAVLASYLSRQASLTLLADDDAAASTSSSSNDQLYLAALAVFQKLAALPSAVPIDVNSLHDFLVVYASDPTSREAKLAKKIVNDLLRRRPSLVRGIETQVLPSYIGVMRDMASNAQAGESNIRQAGALTKSMAAVLLAAEVQQVKTILTAGGGENGTASQFWIALQILYDETLPSALASSIPSASTVESVAGQAVVQQYVRLKAKLLDIFIRFAGDLHVETLLALLEGVAASEDVPDSLASLPATSLLNLSLLADAENAFSLSKSVAARKDVGEQEKQSLVKAITETLAGVGEVKDGQQLFASNTSTASAKGKGKGRASEAEVAQQNSELEIVAQVQAVLPDTPSEIVQRLLSLPSFAGAPESEKVSKAISMILEGYPEASAAPASGLENTNTAPSEAAQPRKSTFAQARSNIFDDAIDTSRLRRGKQDIENDTFLPSELKNAILTAAARQSDDEDSEAEGEGRGVQSAAFLEDLGGEEDAGAASRVRVKDNIDEESDAEEEDDRQHGAVRSGAASRQATRPATPSASGSRLPPGAEARFLALYASDSTVFAREARKSPARADLRKETNCSDEQIEGWRVMFERNPRKDKLLAKVTEFRGNEKGLEVKPGRPGGSKPKPDAERPTQSGDARGGRGGGQRGRGRGGRGGQSEQRRKGNDRKIAKAGGVVG